MTPRKNVIDLGDLDEQTDVEEDLFSVFEDALKSVEKTKASKSSKNDEDSEPESEDTEIEEDFSEEAVSDDGEEFVIDIETSEEETAAVETEEEDEDEEEEVISLAGIMEDALGSDGAKKYKEHAGLEVDADALDDLHDLFEEEALDEKLSSLKESSKIPASQLRGMPRHELPAVRKQEMEARKKEEEAARRIQDLEYALSSVRKEYLSYRGRIETDKKRSLDEFHKEMLLQFLPVLDNLERAMSTTKDGEGDNAGLVEGLQLILNQFNEILKQRNVTPIEALHQPFDPNIHEAMDVHPNDEMPSNTVLEVFQKGYLINDKLLRPSMVIVSKQTVAPKPVENGKGSEIFEEPEESTDVDLSEIEAETDEK